MCDSKLVDKLRKLNDYLLVSNSCAGEVLGGLILEKRHWFVDRVKKLIERNYPIVKKWVDERDDLEWLPPKYGVMAFLRMKKDVNSMELAQLLLSKYSTMLSPGIFFDAEGYIRIGFGGDEKMLQKGLENVGLALDDMG
jgi:aspartate/methionine/tyrosine aminotransferase